MKVETVGRQDITREVRNNNKKSMIRIKAKLTPRMQGNEL